MFVGFYSIISVEKGYVGSKDCRFLEDEVDGAGEEGVGVEE